MLEINSMLAKSDYLSYGAEKYVSEQYYYEFHVADDDEGPYYDKDQMVEAYNAGADSVKRDLKKAIALLWEASNNVGRIPSLKKEIKELVSKYRY